MLLRRSFRVLKAVDCGSNINTPYLIQRGQRAMRNTHVSICVDGDGMSWAQRLSDASYAQGFDQKLVLGDVRFHKLKTLTKENWRLNQQHKTIELHQYVQSD